MMDATYLANKYGEAISHEGWLSLKRMLQWLAKNWQRPDDGIWEVRGGRQHFLHSRLMCWVAFDRAIRLADKRSLAGPLDWMLRLGTLLPTTSTTTSGAKSVKHLFSDMDRPTWMRRRC